MRVNLHCHSNISDGTLLPRDLIKRMSEDKLELIALTDHDKVDGLLEAQIEANKHGIKFVNGIEISCKTQDLNLDFLNSNDGGLHILGLGFNLEIIQKIYHKRIIEKKIRIQKLINTLKENGYDIDFPDNLMKKTSVAESLVSNGYASDVQDAFNRIINKYYDKNRDNMNVTEAIQIIHDANGKAIWAHPFDILNFVVKERIDENKVDLICQRLKVLGIDGIEVYYEPYTMKQQDFLKEMQYNYGFIASVGTDYHAKREGESTYIEVNKSLVMEWLK